MLAPLLRNYAKVIGTITETDSTAIARRIYDYFVANGLTVNSRNITFASPAAGSNQGNGTINRLARDERNYLLECIHVEAKRADCIRDEFTGAVEHEEVFEMRGADREIDDIEITGSGLRVEMRAKSARDSLIRNPSFSQTSGSGASFAVTDWTLSAAASFQTDTTNFYRGFRGDTTPASLRIDANANASQDLDVNTVTLDPTRPYYCQIAYNRSIGSGDGLLTLTMGMQTASVNLASAASGWNVLRIALNSGLWPRNFAAVDDPEIRIEITGRTTGYTLVDDVIFVPMDEFDGTWYTIVGGSTPFVAQYHDTFTWTDSLAATDSIIQYWWWLATGRMLPHNNAGAETWVDPTV